MRQHRSPAAGPFRLVVETDDPALVVSDFSCFRQAGFDVVVCHGPDHEHPCPVTIGGVCEAVVQADVVLNALRDAGVQRTVVDAVRVMAPAVPMVVNVAPGMSGDLPDGCVALPRAASVSGQTDAVRRAAVAGRKLSR